MLDRKLLNIEVLGGSGHPAVLDRVIGGTVYMEEAKRIGHRLVSVAEGETRATGFHVLGPDNRLLYEWHVGDDEMTAN